MKNVKSILIVATYLLIVSAIVGCELEKDDGPEYDFSCRYFNTMSNGDECVEYRGDWTLEEAQQDCYEIFSFLNENTAEVSTVPCDVATDCLGSCTVDRPGDSFIVTRYYEPVDAALLESFCVNPDFGNGIWAYGCSEDDSVPPSDEPVEAAGLAAMVSNADVTVLPECVDVDGACEQAIATAGEWIEFIPTAPPPTTAYVIYPGATVDARAYAPLAQDLAKKGVLTALVPAVGGLSLGVYDRIDAIMADHTEITDWFLGGHSMGGASATRYVWEGSNPSALAGLILLAAYGSADYDISSSKMPVTVIYATKDEIATSQEVEDGKAFLPEHTKYIALEGGNHAQFGYYGEQPGDGEATITKEKQQELLVEFISEAIEHHLEDD